MPQTLHIDLPHSGPLRLTDHTPYHGGDLAGLQQLIGGTLLDTAAAGADVSLCPPEHPIPADAAPTGLAAVCYDAGRPAFYWRIKHPAAAEKKIMRWRHLLLLGCLARLLNGDPLMVMHGVLLETRSGGGLLLCGQSGMGKSTTAARWQNGGGICRADDMILLDCRHDVLQAHPMPTWSRCLRSTDGEYFPITEAVPVRQLLALDRAADTECLKPVEDYRFFLAVYASCSCFVDQYGKWLPDAARRQLIARSQTVARMLCDRFPPVGLFAHLQGDLHRTLLPFDDDRDFPARPASAPDTPPEPPAGRE